MNLCKSCNKEKDELTNTCLFCKDLGNRPTKLCKTCYKEIDLYAKRCSYCQEYLGGWYLHPSFVASAPILIIMLVYLIVVTWFSGTKQFQNYSNQLTMQEVNRRNLIVPAPYVIPKNLNQPTEPAAENFRQVLEITYKVHNSTNIKWGNLFYQNIGYDSSQKVVTTRAGNVYAWVIQPNSDAFLTVEIYDPEQKELNRWETVLTSLDSSR